MSLKYDVMQHMSSYAPRGTETEPREFAGHFCPQRQIMERLGWPQSKQRASSVYFVQEVRTEMKLPVRFIAKGLLTGRIIYKSLKQD